MTGREPERVRAARSDRGLDHRPHSMLRA
jgi:hypothetical protein